MARVIRGKLNKKAEAIILEDFLKEIKKIHSINDLRKFFEMFFTKDEEVLVLRRLAIMQLIAEKKKYKEIKEKLSVSGCTISAVKDILLGQGYNKRDKKIKYSYWPKQNSRKKFPSYPRMVGKGRWGFLYR